LFFFSFFIFPAALHLLTCDEIPVPNHPRRLPCRSSPSRRLPILVATPIFLASSSLPLSPISPSLSISSTCRCHQQRRDLILLARRVTFLLDPAMSSSINIPTGPVSASAYRHSPKAAGSSSGSSYCSSPSRSSSSSPSEGLSTNSRRPSLLSTAISKQESTVINIGDPDGPPRLISYLSSSQGFAWNPEIFLPSYVDCDYVPLENRRDPVHEILLSDEELLNMLPH
jgi:hypothetical protein